MQEEEDEDDELETTETELEQAGSVKYIQLTSLDVELEKAASDGKHTLIFDKSGQAETYFMYKCKCRELHKDLVKIKMGQALLKNVVE